MKVVGYLRVITDRQDTGLEAQRASVERWADYCEHEFIAWLDDADVSGTRPLAKRKAGWVALTMLSESENSAL